MADELGGVGWVATGEGVVDDSPQPARVVTVTSDHNSELRCDNCPKKFEEFTQAVDHAAQFGHTTRYVTESHVVYNPVVITELFTDQVTEIVAIATDGHVEIAQPVEP